MAAELRFPAVALLLVRRIKRLQSFSDGDGNGFGVVFGEDAARSFCCLYFGPDGQVDFSEGAGEAGGFGGFLFSGGGGGGMSVVFSSFAKGRDLVFPAGDLVSGSSASSTAADFLVCHDSEDDGRCSSTRFFVYESSSAFWLCLVVCFYCGRSTMFASSACPGRATASSRLCKFRPVENRGRLMRKEENEGDAAGCVRFYLVNQGVSCKDAGLYCTSV
ncbi:unnamed protein product [Urochloa humidicola]